MIKNTLITSPPGSNTLLRDNLSLPDSTFTTVNDDFVPHNRGLSDSLFSNPQDSISNVGTLFGSAHKSIKSYFARLMLLTILVIAITIQPFKANGQYVITNPLEYLVLAEGNEKINGLIADDTNVQLKTSILQQTLATEFAMMQQWESKYYAYLKTAEGFASSVKAATTLYHDALWIFVSLKKLGSAIASNPSGAVATLSLNNLYAETFIELFTSFNLLKEAVAVGDKENMLNGAQRSKMLWRLEQSVSKLSQKLKLLYRSVKCYSFSTLWDYYTAGMSDRMNAEVAGSAFRRWRQAARSVR